MLNIILKTNNNNNYMLPVEYIWIGKNQELRSKTRIISNISEKFTKEDIPDWNFDGSSTGQASVENSEVILKPKKLFKSPFPNIAVLILCETYTLDNEPHENNTRFQANKLFVENMDREAVFGLEQEYFIFNSKTNMPIGFSEDKEMPEQGQYYCGVGSHNVYGRSIAEEHILLCLKSGISLSGLNAEVAPGQWEFQIGPCVGIDAGDNLWMARYILEKISEKYNIKINYHPKPLEGNWNGSGCHTIFSTKQTRDGEDEKTGLDFIHEAIEKLKSKHNEHMEVYGEHNDLRMTGNNETSKYDTFTSGVGDRNASVRIPYEVNKNKAGYLEDRRPASNMDPYVVTSKIFKTTVLE